MIENKIVKVLKNSIAEELEIEKGDVLLSVNGAKIQDYIDYKYQISDDEITIEVKKTDGEVWELDIEKEYDEDLGIVFENPLMDNIKVCCNKCVFCFVDQMPRGMRKTLYLKDDDTRLSFLYGNFITLTNLSDDEIDRIIKYKISPIKVSVHATDLKLRNELMGKPDGKDVLKYLKKLVDGGITVDCQVVLCKGLNDGKALEKTVKDLSALHPMVRSIAVVPVGLSDHREKLYKLDKFEKEDAKKVIDQVIEIQKQYLKKLGTRFIFIADEFYVLADEEMPAYEEYEDFDQLENGIGIYRLLERQITEDLKKVNKKYSGTFTFVTGVAAYGLMGNIANMISDKTGLNIKVEKIINNCFGKNITVAGLITGKDIIEQLKNKENVNIVIPKVMVEHENNIFLDDVEISQLEKELNAKVFVCDETGIGMVKLLLENSLKL